MDSHFQLTAQPLVMRYLPETADNWNRQKWR